MSEYAVPVDEAMSCLAVEPEYDCGNGPEPCVHTFMDAPFGLICAHWSVSDARTFFERWGVERSGDAAQAMQHGLVVVAGRRTVFFETTPAASAAPVSSAEPEQ